MSKRRMSPKRALEFACKLVASVGWTAVAPQGYDSAFRGVVLVYDGQSWVAKFRYSVADILKTLQERNRLSYSEALDWFDVNIYGGCPTDIVWLMPGEGDDADLVG